MIERGDWSWSPVGDMAFDGSWCDGELRVCDEVFICDVECVSGGVVPPADSDFVVLHQSVYGMVTESTSGAVVVQLCCGDLGWHGASTYLEAVLSSVLS